MKWFFIMGLLLGLAGVTLLTLDLLHERTRQSILSHGQPAEGSVTGIVHEGSRFKPARVTVDYRVPGKRFQQEIDASMDLLELLDWEYEGFAKTPVQYLPNQPEKVVLVADRDPHAPRRVLDMVLLIAAAALVLLVKIRNYLQRRGESGRKSVSPPDAAE